MVFKFPELASAGFGVPLERGSWYVAQLFRGISLGLLVATLIQLVIALFQMDLSEGNVWTSLRRLTLYFLLFMLTIGYVYINTYLWQGITKPDRTGIFPWLIVTTALNTILLIMLLVTFVKGFHIVEIFIILVIGFVFYCIMVVYSYYKELGRLPEPNPTQQTPT